MISFIIIGRNEGWKLTKCFESIYKTVKYNNLENYEIIYVDSKSTDDSIERAKQFTDVKIFQITGECNAAIGRNIGAKESIGEILYFIDGDMEIIPEFLSLIYKENKLVYDFISGQFENNYYDKNGFFLYKKGYHSLKQDKCEATTGGLFAITRKLWVSVNGIRTKYRVNEDLDFGLRLSKSGVKLLRKKELMAKHHTISYRSSNRMWQSVTSTSSYYRAVLLRDHVSNLEYWKIFLRENYTSVFLLISLILYFLTGDYFAIYLYFIITIVRSCLNMKKGILQIPNRFLYFCTRDILMWFFLIFFYPKNIKEAIYTIVRK